MHSSDDIRGAEVKKGEKTIPLAVSDKPPNTRGDNPRTHSKMPPSDSNR